MSLGGAQSAPGGDGALRFATIEKSVQIVDEYGQRFSERVHMWTSIRVSITIV